MADASRKVPVIGLVGGVGSGKSHLARQLADRHPVEIVEGDAAGHEVLKESAVKEQIREAFGAEVFASDGQVDRRKLGRMVFGKAPERQAARQRLESIVHPRITEILKRQIVQARSRPGVEAVILDAALLLEAGWQNLCDVVVFVETAFAERLRRVAEGRGWSAAELQLREESQFPVERKRKEANHVVDNTGDARVALSQLEDIYSRVVSASHS